MKKSLARNYIYNLIYQILILILPLVTAPYISRVLEAENIGIYSYTISISAYFILFGSLGIALYGQREIAFYQKDKEKYSRVFWELVILRFITIVISLIMFYFIFAIGNEYGIYYKILMLEILASCIDISWFFQGHEEFAKTVVRNLLVKILSVICIFVFVKTKDDLMIYYIIYILSIIIGNASLWFYLPKFLVKVKLKSINILKHLKPTLALLIPQIAIQVYTLLDKTMIGVIITDKSEVGFYDQSQKIIKVILAVITSLGTVMMPRIANSFANGEKDKVEEYIKKSFNIIFFMAFPFIFGLIAISNNFVPLFYGEGYDKVAILMCVISPVLLLIGMSNVIGTQYLLPTKKQKEFTISVVCGAVINFFMNFFLISKYGAIGASIGTIVAELAVTGVQIYFVRKEFDFKSIFLMSVKYLIASLTMFIVCLIIPLFLKDSIICIIVQVCCGMIIYLLVLSLLRDNMMRELLNMVKGRKNEK